MTGSGKEGKGQFLKQKYLLFLHLGRCFLSFRFDTENIFTTGSTQKTSESKWNFNSNPPEEYRKKNSDTCILFILRFAATHTLTSQIILESYKLN